MSYLELLNRDTFPFIVNEGFTDAYPATTPLVMTANEVDRLNTAAATSWRFMNTAARAVVNDKRVANALVGPKLARLLADRPLVSRFARLDFVQTLDGDFKLIEVNADTPSGVVEAYYANAVACAAGGLVDVNAGQGWRVHRLFRGYTSPAFAASAVHVEDMATARYVQFMNGTGKAVGLDAIRVNNDRVGLVDDGEFHQVDALYLLHPKEWLINDVDHDGFATGERLLELAAAGVVDLINPLEAIVLQHKGLMALVHETRGAGWVDRAEVEHYLPASTMGAMTEKHVRKPVLGREGGGVSVHAADATLLGGELGAGPLLSQAFVDSRRVSVDTTGGQRSGWLTFSKFIVDGEVDATYVRFNTGVVCDNHAYWLPVGLKRKKTSLH